MFCAFVVFFLFQGFLEYFVGLLKVRPIFVESHLFVESVWLDVDSKQPCCECKHPDLMNLTPKNIKKRVPNSPPNQHKF